MYCILIFYLCISLQIVVQYVHTDSEVTSIVGVGSVPALRTELTSLNDNSMEVAQREEYALELILLSTHLKSVLR